MSILSHDTSKIAEDAQSVECFYMWFDIDTKTWDYCWDSNQLGRILFSEIVDFALWSKKNDLIREYSKTEIDIVGESAKQLYEIKEFEYIDTLVKWDKCIDDDDKTEETRILRRWEFWELILFYVLKHFWKTIPTLSKIYFKDSLGLAAHWFDIVHILKNEDVVKLCLWEAKIYKIWDKWINALIDDLKNHINADFINNEFLIIQKRFSDVWIFENLSDIWKQNIDYLKQILTWKNTLDSLSWIVFPFLCAYEDDIFLKWISHTTAEFQEIMKQKIEILAKQFHLEKNTHPLGNHIQVVLILFPVKSKLELVRNLHMRLYHAQWLVS